MKKKVLAIVITLVLIVLVLPMGFHAEQTNDDCITFSSSAAFSLSATKRWDGTLQYSTDKLTWSTWDGSAISAAEESGTYNIYVRGEGNTKICKQYDYNNSWKLTTTEDGQTISCTGNIETLRGATGNEEASTPMADYCYSGMFYGCTSLVEAPSLPATTLSNYCYINMFYGCSSLKEVPALPVTTLADSCYSYMFNGCSSLTKAPELPATTLCGYCYMSMFEGCSSLTKVPKLPATALVAGCYSSMFADCTALKCPANMSHVTSIEVFDEWLLVMAGEAMSCCYNMYFGCTNLKIYTTPTEDCQTAWLCSTADVNGNPTWSNYMFSNTTGDVNSENNGTPASQVTYYVLYDNDVPDTGDADTALYAVLLIASMLGIGLITARKAKKSFV